MNVVDGALIALILLLGIRAYYHGLVYEAFTILAWLGAAALTYGAFPVARGYAQKLVSQPGLADGLAVVVVFVPVLWILSTIVGKLAAGTNETSVGPINRVLGLIFGVARGVVVVSLAWILVARAVPADDQPEWLSDAKSRDLVEKYGPTVLKAVLPAKYLESVTTEFDSALDRARRGAPAVPFQP